MTPAKRKAQRGIIKQIREVAPDSPRSKSEMPASACKDGGRYRIRTYDFHRVKLTANGKQRTSEESSVIASSVHSTLGAPSNENCAQICTQILDSERLAPSPKSHHQRFLQDRPRRRTGAMAKQFSRQFKAIKIALPRASIVGAYYVRPTSKVSPCSRVDD